MPRILLKIFSVYYWTTFTILCWAILPIYLVVFLLTAPFDSNRKVCHLFTCAWAVVLLTINPLWRWQVKGRQQVPWRGGAVLVANHLSFFDILLLFTLFRPFKWLGKDTFLKIPVMGWVMRLNRYVSVKRSSVSSRGAAYEACREWLRKGVPVVFFPEGTRSQTGALQAFHSGAFRLAVEEKLPLIPIILRGTRDILPKKSFVLNGTAHMSLEVLKPVSPETVAGEDVEQLKHRIREEMKAQLDAQPA